ncbi:MAG: peroxiredoxin-like family protein [Spirochaetales bacterium]|nr:peroxiredoxin-like family protein [Spirochaetales bacterium]
MKDNTTKLKILLEKRKQEFSLVATDKVKKTYRDGIEAVEKSGITKRALNVGDMSPDFSLKNAIGDTVRLYDYLEKGAVVLTWYRGGWCPYCNITLKALQDEIYQIKALGANLIALTPELPDSSISTTEKHNLEFEVLSDVQNIVGRKYDLVYKLTEQVAEIYSIKFGLEDHNGDKSHELPLAATYVINQKGKIVFAFLDADYRNRAEPQDIIEVLKSL